MQMILIASLLRKENRSAKENGDYMHSSHYGYEWDCIFY